MSLSEEEVVTAVKDILSGSEPYASLAQAVKIGKPDAKERCMRVLRKIFENDAELADVTAKLEEELTKIA